MSEVASKPKFMNMVLIAVLVFNVLSIGLSEIQRRQLGQQSYLAVLELQDIEHQRLQEQEKAADQLYKLIDVMEKRVNIVQIALESGPAVSLARDIDARVNAVQTAMDSGSSALLLRDVQTRLTAMQAKLDKISDGK